MKTVAAALGVACALALVALGARDARAFGTGKVCSYPAQKNSGKIRVHLIAHGHHPKVDPDPVHGDWPITVTARTPRGKPISGGYIFYQFLLSGQIVACRTVGPPAHPYFVHGVFHDKLDWPAPSVGYALTLRIVVQTNHPQATRNIDWAIMVRR